MTQMDLFVEPGVPLRIDGTRAPWCHFKPMPGDAFYASTELHGKAFRSGVLDYMYVIALADGQWSIDNHEHIIAANEGNVLFPTRLAAVRAAAARKLREIRKSRHYKSSLLPKPPSRQTYLRYVDWVRGIVREASDVAP